MGSAITRNSYLLVGRCSATNIVWQYMHNNGTSLDLRNCTDYFPILMSHCCMHGTCTPNQFFDREFGRYQWPNRQGVPWHGKGNPQAETVVYNWTCVPIFSGGEISEHDATSPECKDACLEKNWKRAVPSEPNVWSNLSKTQLEIAVAVALTDGDATEGEVGEGRRSGVVINPGFLNED